MGRFYSGDISGKFWFSIQNSQDASFFGTIGKSIIIFQHCECCMNDCEDDEILNKLYCKKCFSSYDEHRAAILTELDQDLDLATWTISDSEIAYEFDITHLKIIKEKVALLNGIVGKYMEFFKIIDKDNVITYDYKLPNTITENNADIELIARLCLGQQILYCMQKKGHCYFTAEL